MNEAENLAPLSIHDENALPGNPQKPGLRRKPLGTKLLGNKPLGNKPLGQLGKSQKPRRALGDITNSSRQLQPLQSQKLRTATENKFKIWRDEDEDDVPEPEIIPPAPPSRPYEPAPLFTAREIADMTRQLEEDDDSTDDFGQPFMAPDPIPSPPPPYSHDDADDHDIGRRGGLTNDYFSPDQMFSKDELPVLELA